MKDKNGRLLVDQDEVRTKKGEYLEYLLNIIVKDFSMTIGVGGESSYALAYKIKNA